MEHLTMCKFHKVVATKLATDEKTGEVNPAKFAVALTALAKYRVEQYAPSLSGVDGYHWPDLLQDQTMREMGQARIPMSLERHARYAESNLPRVKKALDKMFDKAQIDLNKLGLPHDPAKMQAELDIATVELFDGDVHGPLRLKRQAPRAEHEALRKVVAKYMDTPRVEPTLKRLLEGSLMTLFLDAPRERNAARRAGRPLPTRGADNKPCHPKP
ncbi:MAG: hypothetical protein Alpg2KO_10220 [Alphaproteobacteria bacterium]